MIGLGVLVEIKGGKCRITKGEMFLDKRENWKDCGRQLGRCLWQLQVVVAIKLLTKINYRLW